MSVTTAVLFSGGLDSAVLLFSEARRGPVVPLYVRAGLAWESSEQQIAERLVASAPSAFAIAPIVALDFTVRDLYPPTHWALAGTPPAYDTPDEDVYLVGRNLALLAKAGIHCARHGIARIALGPLAGNPFPDARPEFFDSMARSLTLGLDEEIEIATPFGAMHKEDVIRLGERLGVPLELTLSCMNPIGLQHCGACSKCRERRDAFAAAGVPDPTVYRAAESRR
jgi:7-cyano-7-deazaguanine synthase